MTKQKQLLTLLLLHCAWPGASSVQAAVTEAWVHRYSNVVNDSHDQAVKVAHDPVGNMIVTGTSGSAILTIKYSGADGSVLWQRRDDSGAVNALAVDDRGNVVIAGYSYSYSSPERRDFYTAKYAATDGTLLWEKRYNSPGNRQDAAYALALDSSGNVLMMGFSESTFEQYTAKYAAADGALLWEKRRPSVSAQRWLWSLPVLLPPSLVAVDGSGNVLVSGASRNDEGQSGYDTAKYAAADGALIWEKRYDVPGSSFAMAVAVDQGGNVIVIGASDKDNGQGSDYYTAKYAAADGALLWEKRYNSPADGADEARALAVDTNGNVVVTGYSWNDTVDYYTAKYAAADGALLWEKRYNGLGSGFVFSAANAVAVDGSGNVVVTGTSRNDTTNAYYTAKYAAVNGTLLWERYTGPADDNNAGYSLALDGSANVVVTGESFNGSPKYDTDYYTAKYAADDGALLWEKRYDGEPPNHNDKPVAVAVDGGGNIVVTGSSQSAQTSNGSGNPSDYYTAKYAAVDGALLWEHRYGGPTLDYYRNTRVLAVDGGGDVVVTGSACSAGTSWDYYTAKYAGADGALLWEKHYDGPAKLDDIPHALAVDASGNVVVTGESGRTSAQRDVHDFYTAKYAAADGATLWEKRYNGPANSDNAGYAVAVDGKDNVIVSGLSARSGSTTFGFNYDGYTAKYAALDGAVVWEKRIGGAMALDDNGNVVLVGYVDNRANPGDYVRKYAAADGEMVWETRLTGRIAVNMVAVDHIGNVVMTGFTANGNGTRNFDYHTAKYAAADGALLWEKRYNGPDDLEDIPQAVGVDANGNVVVTGTSATSDSKTRGLIHDYYTAKYAAADGALLWEKRYNGPANGDDYASSLAIGPNGMVVVTGASESGAGYGAAYDYATVVYRDVPSVVIDWIAVGIRLRFPGVKGRSYIIERATAVTGPWTSFDTQTTPLSGVIEFLDTAPPVGAAFYRTREP
jgi:uncharacterized delta-60 repeat protein